MPYEIEHFPASSGPPYDPERVSVSIGGIDEFSQWFVYFDYEADNANRCPHCGPMFEVEHERRAPPFTTWKEQRCVVPRVVVIFNEGGQAFTAVCLDCILAVGSMLPQRLPG